MIWSLFYVPVNILIPGSFSVQIIGSPFEQVQNFLYYSFVTLTTLGYGDITPIRGTARALSTIEEILGQLYRPPGCRLGDYFYRAWKINVQ